MNKQVLKKIGKVSLFVLFSLLIAFGSFFAGQAIGPKQFSIADKYVVTIGMAGVAYAATPDYVCDGVLDDVQFQQAINALPPTGIPAVTGGELYILAGNYVFANTVTRAINNVTINGVGRSASITTTGVVAPFTCTGQTGWTFKNFSADEAPAYTKTYGVSASTVVDGIWVNSVFTIDKPSPENNVRTATLVVAAYNATASEAQADMICDGVADDVQINAVIAALTAGRTRKQAIKLTGSFSTSASITVPSYTVLDLSTANITLAASSDCDMFQIAHDAQDVDFIGGVLDGNGTNQGAGDWDIIYFVVGAGEPTRINFKGVTFKNAHYYTIDFDGSSNNIVDGCYFNTAGYNFIRLHATDYTKIINNHFSGTVGMCDVSCDGRENIIANNTFLNIPTSKYGIYFQADGVLEVRGNSVIGNKFVGDYPTTPDAIAIYSDTTYLRRTLVANNVFYKMAEGILNGGQEMTVSSNVFIDGVYAWFTGGLNVNHIFSGNYCRSVHWPIRAVSADGLDISNNQFFSGDSYTLWLQGVIDTKIDGNVFHSCGNGADNTYPIIRVTKDYSDNESTGLVISNNLAFTDTGTNKPKYFIEDVDTGVDYFVHSNKASDLGTSFTNKTLPGVAKDNIGYIAPGEIRTYAITIIAGTEDNTTYWQNPFAQNVWVKEIEFNLTTAASATNPTYDIKLDTDGSGVPDGTAFLDGVPDTAGTYWSYSNFYGGDASGVQTDYIQLNTNTGTTDWIGFCIEDAAGADCAGVMYITILGQ